MYGLCWGNRLVIWNDRAMPIWVRPYTDSARDVLPLEMHRAFGGLELAGENVEQSGLAGAVGTDESQPLPRLDAEGHLAQGCQDLRSVSRCLGRQAEPRIGLLHPLRIQTPRPSGITMIVTTNRAPRMSGQRSGRYRLARYSIPTKSTLATSGPKKTVALPKDHDQESDVAGDHGQVVGVHDPAEIGEHHTRHAAEDGGDDPGGVLVEPCVVAQRLHAPLVVVYAPERVSVPGVDHAVHDVDTDDRDEEHQVVVAAARHVDAKAYFGLRYTGQTGGTARDRPERRWPRATGSLRRRSWPAGNRWDWHCPLPPRTPERQERQGLRRRSP